MNPMNPVCLAPPYHLAVQMLLRHRQERFQLGFAREAAQLIPTAEDHLACPSGAGLLLYGATEQSLAPPLAELHDCYHGCLEQHGPHARCIEDETKTALEPVMYVRVRTPLACLAAVKRDLLARDGRILEQHVVALRDVPPREGVLRALAPMSRLIGFAAALEAIAGGAAQHIMALDSYAPVPPPSGPVGGEAA